MSSNLTGTDRNRLGSKALPPLVKTHREGMSHRSLSVSDYRLVGSVILVTFPRLGLDFSSVLIDCL